MSFAEILARADVQARTILGEAVTYTPGAGLPATVDGIFDAAYLVVDPDAGQAGVSSSGPAVFLKLADLTSDPGLDSVATVTIRSVVYTWHEVKPDGTGGVLLLLHEV